MDAEGLEKAEEREGWETIVLNGQTYGVRTFMMDEKCQALETPVIYYSMLGVALVLSGADARRYASLFSILLPRECERIMGHVRSSPFLPTFSS